MIAFHGQRAIKDKYVARVQMHRKADNLIRGTGWDGHRGCAVGCTIEKCDHSAYETELGIPCSLALIEDSLFESLPLAEAMEWPEKLLTSIPVSADLSMVTARFLHWLLIDPTDGVIKFARYDRSKEAITAVGNLYARKIAGEIVTAGKWEKAAAAANAAAYAANAAAYAAYAANAADAAAYAAYAAADAADKQARSRQARKLIELLEIAPVALETA